MSHLRLLWMRANQTKVLNNEKRFITIKVIAGVAFDSATKEYTMTRRGFASYLFNKTVKEIENALN